MKKRFCYIYIVLLIFIPFSGFTLDISSGYEVVSESFDPFLDPNEGLTVFRSLLIPIGGRAESLGTAFTALANDISFFEYNPAASSTLTNTEAAFFHNAWIADSALETIAFTRRTGNLGYGTALKCFYVPFTEYNVFGERVARGYYSETTGILNASYNFFSGYYFRGLALGGNFKFSFRSMPDYTDNMGHIISGSGLSQSAFAVMGDFGVQLRFNFLKPYHSREPNLHIGMSITNAGAAFLTEGILDDPLPTRIGFGFSYQFMNPVTISFEIQQPVNLQNFSKSEKFSIGTGLRIQFASFFSLHGGLLLKGANPRFSLGGEVIVRNILFNINYTLDLTSSLAPFNRISLSAKLNLGDSGRGKTQEQVERLYEEGLEYYYNGELQMASNTWQMALNLNPQFDPVHEALQVALDALQLQNKIKVLQSLE